MNPEEFDALYRTESRRIMALCLHLTGNAALAEDALQETFYLALRARGQFRADSAPSTWLYRIGIRAAQAASRRERAEHERRRAAQRRPLASASHAVGSAPGEAEPLYDALRSLPDEQRTALALAAVHDLTAPQIAAILDIPLNTVYSRIHAARNHLRAALAPAHRSSLSPFAAPSERRDIAGKAEG